MSGSKQFSIRVQFQNPETKQWEYTDKSPNPLPTVNANDEKQARDRFLLDPANSEIAKGVIEGTVRVSTNVWSDPSF